MGTHYVGAASLRAFKKTPNLCIGLTALLHDIGKTSAAKVIHHRQLLVFQGHESY